MRVVPATSSEKAGPIRNPKAAFERNPGGGGQRARSIVSKITVVARLVFQLPRIRRLPARAYNGSRGGVTRAASIWLHCHGGIPSETLRRYSASTRVHGGSGASPPEIYRARPCSSPQRDPARRMNACRGVPPPRGLRKQGSALAKGGKSISNLLAGGCSIFRTCFRVQSLASSSRKTRVVPIEHAEPKGTSPRIASSPGARFRENGSPGSKPRAGAANPVRHFANLLPGWRPIERGGSRDHARGSEPSRSVSGQSIVNAAGTRPEPAVRCRAKSFTRPFATATAAPDSSHRKFTARRSTQDQAPNGERVPTNPVAN